MSRSQIPSQAEVRRVMRLVHEACELGEDTLLWRRHIAEGLCRLVGARAAFHEEEQVTVRPETSLIRGAVILGMEGWAAAEGLQHYMLNGGFHTHPFFSYVLPIANRPWTRSRREIVPRDADYYGSIVSAEYKRPADIDDTIHSRMPLPRPGWSNLLALFGDWGEGPFTVRHRRIVHLAHAELAHLWNRPDPPDPAEALPRPCRRTSGPSSCDYGPATAKSRWPCGWA